MTEIVSIHQWVNGGDEVLIVRFASKDGKSASKRLVGGESVDAEPFTHPIVVGEMVTAPDWDSSAKCGGGIHGWPWALSLGDGKDPDWDALWQVYGVKPEDIVVVDPNAPGKVKFRTGTLRHIGTWDSATNFVLAGQMAWVHASSRGAASSTGYSGAASSTGSRGAASSTGSSGAAMVTGINGKARGGEFGCIALAWWNEKEQRGEMRCSRTGKGQECKANVWYELDANGKFVEVQP